MGFSLSDVNSMTPEERRFYLLKLKEEFEQESVEASKLTKRGPSR